MNKSEFSPQPVPCLHLFKNLTHEISNFGTAPNLMVDRSFLSSGNNAVLDVMQDMYLKFLGTELVEQA